MVSRQWSENCRQNTSPPQSDTNINGQISMLRTCLSRFSDSLREPPPRPIP
ncbi:hypothetical protein J6590_086389 [Homalodisca vitripennis]|nr:hypothetical protein J6590_086389 [Homalodisca vitripennis]